MNDSKTTYSHLLADNPISSSSQDRLGRSTFAKSLAADLEAYSNPESLVVGLYGPWGSGKSSLLNLVQEQLQTESSGSENLPIIIRFDPWNFKSIEQLIFMFFQSMRSALGNDKKDKRIRSIRSGLDKLSQILNVGSLSPLGSQYFTIGAKALHNFGKEKRADDQITPEEIKKQIDTDLTKIGRRIIVFIDDLDRLEPDSIQLIFRLVRLNAAFTNTTYVLAFDRGIVETSLDRNPNDGSGRSYLEKIIQVGIDVPPVRPKVLEQLFFNELEKIRAWVPIAEWESSRWSRLYLIGVRHLIHNYRDIIRFVNGVNLRMPLIAHEVNPVDFVALEAIRTFAPRTFRFFEEHQEFVLGIGEFSQPSTDEADLRKSTLDKIFFEDQPNIVEKMRELCFELFPPLRVNYSNSATNYSSDPAWRRSKRVCAPEFFPRYFHLDISNEEVSEFEIDQFLRLPGNVGNISNLFKRLLSQDRLRQFLYRVEDRVTEIDPEQVLDVQLSLFDVAISAGWDAQSEVDEPNQDLISHMATVLLKRIDQGQTRTDDLIRLIQQTDNLGALVHFIEWLQDEPGSSTSLDKAGLDDALEKTVGKIRRAAMTGSLPKEPDFGRILFRWRDWAKSDDPANYVIKLTQNSDQDLVEFLVAMTTVKVSSSEGESERTTVIPEDAINLFINPISIDDKVREIKRDKWNSLSKMQQDAVDAYLVITKAW